MTSALVSDPAHATRFADTKPNVACMKMLPYGGDVRRAVPLPLEPTMRGIIYLVGLVVVVGAVLSFVF